MNRRRTILAVAFAASFAAGCATPTTAPPVDIDDKVYVTGSRIPKNDRASVKTAQDSNDIKDMIRRPGSASPGIGGVGGN